jgi:arylsulfatase A-like enzyme
MLSIGSLHNNPIVFLIAVLFTSCWMYGTEAEITYSETAGYTGTEKIAAENAAATDQGIPDRPNIIVMYSDDHTAQAVGAYRGALNYGLRLDHTPTPHIDQLAERGIRFDNAFVTNSICVPSRAVMLTGLHSHVSGVKTNSDPMPVDLETFPVLLQEAGYQTAMIGKWHLSSEPQGFDYYEVLYGQGPYYNPTMRTPDGDAVYHGHTTGIITDIALRWLRTERDRDAPFMMIYNHKAPHGNWLPGPALEDYQDRDLPEPTTLFYDYSGLTTAAEEQQMTVGSHMSWGFHLKVPNDPETGEPNENYERMMSNVNDLTREQRERIERAYAEDNEYLYRNYKSMSEEDRVRWRYQRYVKDYLRTVRELDDEVGRLMAWLTREDLVDNTIIIYAGDQGFFLGEKGLFDKRFIYEESMRMPLIVHWPDGIDAGMVDQHLVQNLDFAPTILEAAGVEIPSHMQGRSFLPLLQGEDPEKWGDAAYYQYYEGPGSPRTSFDIARHYGLRTYHYTLVHFYDYDEWELFDLAADPDQLTSVYGDPEYADIQQELKEKLDALQEQYGDDTWQ